MRAVDKTTHSRPPTINDVKIYFCQKGMPEPEALAFYRFYEKRRWTNQNGALIENWKKFACYWIVCLTHDNPFLFDRRIR